MPKNHNNSKSNHSLAINLLMIVAGMLALSYASVPLYRMFCKVTGYGGTTQESTSAPQHVLSREMTIRFNADISPNLPWQFKPAQTEVRVKVGEQKLISYTARNLSDTALTGRAVYNVTPFQAGAYFVKMECFCFKEQTLPPGKKNNMPVVFYIDPALMDDPEMKDVKTITLSYTFFPVKTEAKQSSKY